ncbi:MAG: hypothetical protein K6C95_09275 [Lachnospiraceae bacterium]|nr:hypothetical protein [Lachnospiraceae bacterium]
MREETKQDLLSIDELSAKYDNAAKVLWKNREILAPLLKYSVTELENCSAESIMRLIDADSISEDMPVSDLPPTILELGTEQSSTTEKIITYDLRFNVKNPLLSTGKLLLSLHIDLEFQNKYRPTLKDGRSYPLIKRAVYYIAREISSQLGRITERTNYADIEKVISIWIVNEDIPEKLQNTATRYYLRKEDFIGIAEEPKKDFDLIEVIMIRRGEKDDITEPLFEYLQSVYDGDIEKIVRYTPASANKTIVEEVKSMPGMSQVIYSKGIAEGISQGIAQGISQGREQGVSQGITIGQNNLVTAVERLRSGETREELIASGLDEHTVDLAMTIK